MPRIGIIAEGPTDQVVIKNILVGYIQGQQGHEVAYVQPPIPWSEKTAGWGHVFQSLRRRDHEGALQFNDYIVIHIDTDVQEEKGFDVARRDAGGKEFTVVQRVRMVVDRLKKEIGTEFLEANAERIIFAIAVDTIECWLMPLHVDKKKASKTAGCLGAVSTAMRKANQKPIWNGKKKFVESYENASEPYRKKKVLLECRATNPSLQVFLDQLEELLKEDAIGVDNSEQPNGGQPKGT